MLGSRMHEDPGSARRKYMCYVAASKEWTAEFNVRQVEFVRM